MSKQAAPVARSKSLTIILLSLFAVAGYMMMNNCDMGFFLSHPDYSSDQSKFVKDVGNIRDFTDVKHYDNTDDKSNVAEVLGETEWADITQSKGDAEKRDDKEDKKKKNKKSILDQTYIRVLIGIGVFAIFNIATISIHHIVLKVSTNTHQYREVDHVYSPF